CVIVIAHAEIDRAVGEDDDGAARRAVASGFGRTCRERRSAGFARPFVAGISPMHTAAAAGSGRAAVAALADERGESAERDVLFDVDADRAACRGVAAGAAGAIRAGGNQRSKAVDAAVGAECPAVDVERAARTAVAAGRSIL